MDNPWEKLPTKPRFVLSEDLDVLQKSRGRAKDNLIFNILPDAIIGNVESARVLFLALNPGYKPTDVDDRKAPGFNDEIRRSLCQRKDAKFYFLDQRFKESNGYRWWDQILKSLTDKLTHEMVAKNISCVQYFPYHSEISSHIPEVRLPSQEYSFSLVRQAMEKKKLIVVMRSVRRWCKSIEELASYENLVVLRGPRRPYVSQNNTNFDDFEKIVRALKP